MSTSAATSESSNYIFRAKTNKAFVIKILSELLAHTCKQYSPFRIDNEGIHLNAACSKSHQLIDFSLYRENFFGWKNARTLNFMVNSDHFHRMLKAIKKKDTITMFIKEDDDCKLGICVETSDENNKTNTNIRITYIQQTKIMLPGPYPNPTICSNKEFQKMKNLHNMAQEMKVTCPYPGLIKFYCDGGEIYEREVVLGHEQKELDDIDPEAQEFCETFCTSYITTLTKCANQSENVQIFVKNKMPLKIKMKAGTLGDLTIFIKSNERIAFEQEKLALTQVKQPGMTEEDTIEG